jgi:APA family basic amino acid/polyamine antiporter
LWVGTVATLVLVILDGLPRFDAARAFDFPPGAFTFDQGFVLGLGAASLIAVYDYLGYYDVCYVAGEVKDPGRVIPRSIQYSIVAIFVAYLLLHLAVNGVMPWRETLKSPFVISDMIEHLHGRGPAVVVTVMILWTAFGSVFALLLGYSRIPYAAAAAGDFFPAFARVHARGFPHVSLYAIGAVAIAASFFSLDAVIKALVTGRVLVQFVGQIVAVPLLRRRLPPEQRPYSMWLYPLPAIVALLGWGFIFFTSGQVYIAAGVGTLLAGLIAFLLKTRREHAWPFAAA